ncbi:hypothetical protein RRG08_016237 [Elysia crispata]|uniref:Uncharacterized protein n=1 Tax=Elysia crispata TaxID=231223 RepID=A0AAE0ZPI3_9GAST|nr:hypothetical protein RRG08_016237 [Elysia crispata]
MTATHKDAEQTESAGADSHDFQHARRVQLLSSRAHTRPHAPTDGPGEMGLGRRSVRVRVTVLTLCGAPGDPAGTIRAPEECGSEAGFNVLPAAIDHQGDCPQKI